VKRGSSPYLKAGVSAAHYFMRFEDTLRGVTGDIHLEIFRGDKIIGEYNDHNLVVDVGRKRLAALAAGKVEN